MTPINAAPSANVSLVGGHPAGSGRGRKPRVLVTGAAETAAIAFLQAATSTDVELWAGDTDRYAPGLYLVPSERRVILPTESSLGFADELLITCCELAIDVLVPTLDSEIARIAKILWQFEAAGVKVLAPSSATITTCLDNFALMETLGEAGVRVPRTSVVDGTRFVGELRCPYVVKPRYLAAPGEVLVVENEATTPLFAMDGSRVAQEYLAGQEYSLDVLAYRDGHVASVVPRARLRAASGIAIAGATVVDPELETLGRRVAEVLELTSVATVQVRPGEDGVARVIGVIPRFPAGIALTVASGVDMPSLALSEALGREVPHTVSHRSLGMVRSWEPRFVEVDELEPNHHVALTSRSA